MTARKPHSTKRENRSQECDHTDFDDGGKTAGRIAIRTVAPQAGSGSGIGESPKWGMARIEVMRMANQIGQVLIIHWKSGKTTKKRIASWSDFADMRMKYDNDPRVLETVVEYEV